MLELKNIVKDYPVGDGVVHALKGIDIAFRRSEFVSVLGPSGCGKTTLLNIIGGLDHYTDGDLRIDGVSTKNYTDRDWDTYRNHRIGFVFQSYNLIPHQTVLENVELALTISGVEKAERIARAKEALDKVGLVGQYDKKPNQLSGGQCQRVAIARALVNDPEILLADEPTGALDTKTSAQIMDLMKQIAGECLVIMVTHNPELAQKYSTRIVRLLDGNMVDDSNPFDPQTEKQDVEIKPVKKQPAKKSKLSFWSAFRLSARNLMSKLKRTGLVCFAGSIGIIGVATVLAISTGVQSYIAAMQDDMLSGNPITISRDAYDLSAMVDASQLNTKQNVLEKTIRDGYINVNETVKAIVEGAGSLSSFKITNDITKQYLDYVNAMPKSYYSAITTNYGVNMSNNLYTQFNFDGNIRTTSLSAANSTYGALLETTDYKDYASMISLVSESFSQAPDNKDFILSQYDVLSDPSTSKIATEADEIMIVVSKKSSLSDLTLAQFGYFSQKEFFNILFKAVENEDYNEAIWRDSLSYDELMGKEFVWYPNDTVFTKNTNPVTSQFNPFTYNAYAKQDWQGKKLKVTAILRPKENTNYGCMQSGFYYTKAFAEQVIEDSLQSEIVNYLNEKGEEGFSSMSYQGRNIGITYTYNTWYNGTEKQYTGFVGGLETMTFFMSQMGQNVPTVYSLTLRDLGGEALPSMISVYPVNFELKNNVTSYLSKWNEDGDIVVDDSTIAASERTKVTYTDNLSIVIGIINDMIDIVTAALVAFTALSLVVSTVMIAIITYVSVIERVKEIGVIRSLGGRKSDVSALFNAETFIIGSISGLIGVGITYLIVLLLNIILDSLFAIGTIAILPLQTAGLMVAISIVLTLISGLIPASLAARKDPVEALRSE